MGKIVARQNERSLSRTAAQSRRALSTVKDDCGFHFYTEVGNYTGVNATSIQELAERMRTISLDSVKFHFGRGDFQRWIRTIFCDSQLAENIGLISPDFSGEELRQEIVKKIEDRLSELKLMTPQIEAALIRGIRSRNGDSVTIVRKTAFEKYRGIRDAILDFASDVDAAIVDGVHDKETLRRIGFVNPVFTRSKYPYLQLADRIARKYSSVVILTDFDAEGKLANEILDKLLDERGVRVCKSCRETVEILLKEEKITTIEGIYRLLI